MINYTTMKKLPNNLEKTLVSYVKWETSYSYMQDIVTNYIEKKNLKNETLKINMIMNDLRWVKTTLENWNVTQAKENLEFVKNTLLYIN